MLLAKSCDLLLLFVRLNVCLPFPFCLHCTCHPWWIHYLKVEAILSLRWLFQCLVSSHLRGLYDVITLGAHNALIMNMSAVRVYALFKHDKRATNGETDRTCAKLQTVKIFLGRQARNWKVLHRIDKFSAMSGVTHLRNYLFHGVRHRAETGRTFLSKRKQIYLRLHRPTFLHLFAH